MRSGIILPLTVIVHRSTTGRAFQSMPIPQLSRRERQIMDSLYRRGQATVPEIQRDLPDAPTDSAIRAMLRLLEAKGQVKRSTDARPHMYFPRVHTDKAGVGAVRHLVRTFFAGSHERAIQAILSSTDANLTAEEFGRLEQLIAEAAARGKRR